MPKGTQDYSLTKRAFAKQNFSEEQIVELQNCMDPISGPAFFMEHFVKIQHPTKGGIKFEPFEFQERLIHTYSSIVTASTCCLDRQVKQHVRPHTYFGMQCL